MNLADNRHKASCRACLWWILFTKISVLWRERPRDFPQLFTFGFSLITYNEPVNFKEVILTILSGKTALITGASSGLGVDFARQLAAMGANLILVARRTEKLETVKQEIEEKYPVRVNLFPQDFNRTECG